MYVAYDDFSGDIVDARVAVSYGASPVNMTADNQAGTEDPLETNPGLRLAGDPRNGTMYALYEQSTGDGQPKSVTYKLDRSADGGATWALNGSPDGLTVDTVSSRALAAAGSAAISRLPSAGTASRMLRAAAVSVPTACPAKR